MSPVPFRRLLLAALLLFPAAAPAARHSLGVGVGLRAATVREDLLVPLAFSGTGLRLDLRYRGLVGPGLLSARLEAGMRTLWNRHGHFAAGLDHGLEASWLVGVPTSADGWRFALGPALAHDAQVNYLQSWDDAHGYWLGARWLGLSARIVRGLGEGWRLEATPTVALLGFQSRPPVYRFNKQDALDRVGFWFEAPVSDGAFAGFWDLQAVRLDLALRPRPLHASDAAGGWSFGVDSRLSRAADPAAVIALESVFYAAYAWEWK